MFEQTLFGNTKKVLAVLGKSHVLQEAYLAGGTALSLQLGHRVSIDLDFFTSEYFDAGEVSRALKGLLSYKVEQSSQHTLLGSFGNIKFSLFLYSYPTILKTKEFAGIRLLDAREIGAMKLAAIGGRGTRRDFVDLYFICGQLCSLKQLFRLYDRKFGSLATDMFHVQKALVYFRDAEKDPMPRMLKKVCWTEVKKFFESQVKNLNDFWKS